ncbi:hypothetical protein NDU88_008827 [Pleurodeles waltl]|uniref:Uncharacterized protein n=1 Tax=Pleurodeles waltl TaxID=8319 RepID=A0AAV7QVS8_PLEWA|nr:hypothetical protein NDU88_008827 [Pleurodeles waltl]
MCDRAAGPGLREKCPRENGRELRRKRRAYFKGAVPGKNVQRWYHEGGRGCKGRRRPRRREEVSARNRRSRRKMEARGRSIARRRGAVASRFTTQSRRDVTKPKQRSIGRRQGERKRWSQTRSRKNEARAGTGDILGVGKERKGNSCHKSKHMKYIFQKGKVTQQA